jgi:hypothetical protein
VTLSLFSSVPAGPVDSTDAQCTPRWLADLLPEFDTDPCTNPRSHVRARIRYMLELDQDGLTLPWHGLVWCNGPYSNPLPWCQRLRAHDGPWVALWKLDTTTAWWRELMAAKADWAPFRERLAFERRGNVGVANFTSVLVWRDWEPTAAVAARLWIR